MADTNTSESTNNQTTKGKKKREQILIGVGIVSLILVWILFRKSSSTTNTTATATQTAALTQYNNQVQAQLNTLASQLASLHYDTVGATAPTGSGATSSEQQRLLTMIITTWFEAHTAKTTTPPSSHTTATGQTSTANAQLIAAQNKAPRGGSLGGITEPNGLGGTGSPFAGIPTWAQATALMHEGVQLFWQPSPGIFQAASTAGHLIIPPGTNTSLYEKG